MNYKAQFYILLTILVISVCSLMAYYLINHYKNSVDNNSVKVTFDAEAGCGPPDDLWRKRIFKTYHLNTDTVNNPEVLKAIKNLLDSLKQASDSIHGIKIAFTNDMPYKYYLELVTICIKRKPKYFSVDDNEIYVVSKSKYQIKEDSIADAFNDNLKMDMVYEK